MEELRYKETKVATPEDYHNTFQVSPTGMKVLGDLMKAHYFYSSTFSPDPCSAARNEGERNVVLRILTIIEGHLDEKKGA